jgi:hypothetical protein
LIPCKPVKARKLLRDGKAIKRWNKLGIFYVRLNFDPKKPSHQPLAIGIDPGSKFEGFSVVGTKDTVLNVMSEAVDWVKKAVEQRRWMRRARRYRKTRCRECRGDNRLTNRDHLPPSTKARWDAKLRIIKQLQKILPISIAVVEDVKAETRKNHRRWNASFSPLEQGKQYFYSELRKSLQLTTKEGWEAVAGTMEERDQKIKVIADRAGMTEALTNVALGLAGEVRWRTEEDYHKEAVNSLTNEELVKILRGEG